jgi:Leucine-rich repeat (LRR) protein
MLYFPRSRLRFSLRTLLLLIAALAIYFGNLCYRSQQQKRIVALLEKLDTNSVGYSPSLDHVWAPAWLRRAVGDDYFANVTAIHLYSGTNSKNLSEIINQLSQLPKLHTVYLWDAKVTDDDFRQLTKLTQVSCLGFRFTWENITGVGLKYLIGMKNISQIDLSGTNIDNAALQYLPHFPALRTLSVGETHINDDGLCHLKDCLQLEDLTLFQCICSGNGLKAIAGCPKLKKLTFHNMGLQCIASESEGIAELIDQNQISMVPTDGLGATCIGCETDDEIKATQRIFYQLLSWFDQQGIAVGWYFVR